MRAGGRLFVADYRSPALRWRAIARRPVATRPDPVRRRRPGARARRGNASQPARGTRANARARRCRMAGGGVGEPGRTGRGDLHRRAGRFRLRTAARAGRGARGRRSRSRPQAAAVRRRRAGRRRRGRAARAAGRARHRSARFGLPELPGQPAGGVFTAGVGGRARASRRVAVAGRCAAAVAAVVLAGLRATAHERRLVLPVAGPAAAFAAATAIELSLVLRSGAAAEGVRAAHLAAAVALSGSPSARVPVRCSCVARGGRSRKPRRRWRRRKAPRCP